MEEEILVKQMQTGDRKAFDQIYEKYQNKILRMAYLITGNQSDSEDIMQETFIKCFIHCKELRDVKGFSSWLYQILTRTAWQYGKKKSRELPDEEIEQKIEQTDGFSTLDLMLQKEESSEIRSVLTGLDMKYRIVVIYYYYNQMSVKEIARICNCMEGTVKSRLFTARRYLKGKLSEKKAGKDEYDEKKSDLGKRINTSFVR